MKVTVKEKPNYTYQTLPEIKDGQFFYNEFGSLCQKVSEDYSYNFNCKVLFAIKSSIIKYQLVNVTEIIVDQPPRRRP